MWYISIPIIYITFVVVYVRGKLGVGKLCPPQKNQDPSSAPHWKKKNPIYASGVCSPSLPHQFITIFGLINYVPVYYGDYNYPVWSEVLGWLMAIVSLVVIPLVMVIKLIFVAKGNTLLEVILQKTCSLLKSMHTILTKVVPNNLKACLRFVATTNVYMQNGFQLLKYHC